jgi:Fur family peroxide stress response transcriptional regulator
MDTSPAAVESRVAAFRARCAALGLALTPQRLAIYAMLAGDPTHPTAEEVFRHVKPGMPSLSLATVYRTLELFEGHGLVSRVLTDGAQARFDANLDEHHHLLCVRCRAVHDFRDDRLSRLPVAAPAGFRVLGHRVQVLGLCPSCQGG